MSDDVGARIARMLDQLEDPTLSPQKTAELQQRIGYLRENA